MSAPSPTLLISQLRRLLHLVLLWVLLELRFRMLTISPTLQSCQLLRLLYELSIWIQTQELQMCLEK